MEGREKESVFFHWYRFLQLVDGYSETHPLWKDFGDIQLPFHDWWDEVQLVFLSGSEWGVIQLNSDDEITEARAEGALIVRVDRSCTREFLMEAFLETLAEEGIGKQRGRRKHAEEEGFSKYPAKYPVYQRPNLRVLNIIYEVWIARHLTQPQPSLYEVGCKLKLNPSAIHTRRDSAKVKEDKTNSMNATVSRYERYARNIIKNVGQGVFPKYTWP